MRPRRRPVVHTEHGFDDAVQLRRKVNGAGPTPVGATLVFEVSQIDVEGRVEERDRARDYDGSAPGVLLHHGQAMRTGEVLYHVDVCGCRTAGRREFGSAEMLHLRLAGHLLSRIDATSRWVAGLPAHEQGHFQTLGRVGIRNRTRALHWQALASCKEMFRHDADVPSSK